MARSTIYILVDLVLFYSLRNKVHAIATFISNLYLYNLNHKQIIIFVRKGSAVLTVTRILHLLINYIEIESRSAYAVGEIPKWNVL